MPVLLYSRPLGRVPVLLHLFLQTLGATTFVLSLLLSRPGWLPWGGSLVATSALVFVVNVAPMCRTVERWNWHGVLIAAAVFFYAATNVWGLVLALNLHTGFLGGDPYLLLAAHLALGLVGWFSLLIAGAGLKLVPMFAPASPLPGWLWPGALLMALGALGYAGGVMYSFRHRRAGPLDLRDGWRMVKQGGRGRADCALRACMDRRDDPGHAPAHTPLYGVAAPVPEPGALTGEDPVPARDVPSRPGLDHVPLLVRWHGPDVRRVYVRRGPVDHRRCGSRCGGAGGDWMGAAAGALPRAAGDGSALPWSEVRST
ncbi:MAG: hypothetical protein JWN15_660 [Firmicutes bacterium]|nr:hypothetical protein [Bacillota bacterium]